MRDGILTTIQARFRHIIVEGDNQTVIHVAQGSGRVPWRIHHLLKDIQCWLTAGVQLLFKHTF